MRLFKNKLQDIFLLYNTSSRRGLEVSRSVGCKLGSVYNYKVLKLFLTNP